MFLFLRAFLARQRGPRYSLLLSLQICWAYSDSGRMGNFEAKVFMAVGSSLDAARGEGDLVWHFLDDFNISHIEASVDWQYERTNKLLWKVITF